MPYPDDEEATRYREEMINRIGNLTVLTTKMNSSISNRSWNHKRGALNEHAVLLMNSALASLPDWNESSIEERSSKLGHQFCQIWPR